MANICTVEMRVVLPLEFEEDFLSLFWGYSKDKDKEKEEGKRVYFPVCFFNNCIENAKDEGTKLVDLTIFFDCKWSVYSSLVDGYPQEDDGSITLKEALKRYKIKYLYLLSEEPGIGFNERLEYQANRDDLDDFNMEDELEEREYWSNPSDEYIELDKLI